MSDEKDQLAVRDISETPEFKEGVRVTLYFVADFLKEQEKSNDYSLTRDAIALGKYCANGDTTSAEYLAALGRFRESEAVNRSIKGMQEYFSGGSFAMQGSWDRYMEKNKERFKVF
jgi:hypothetical protein